MTFPPELFRKLNHLFLIMYKIEKVCEHVHLGEGPHWDVDTQSLYFVDIIDSFICKYTPSTKKFSKAQIGA